MPANLENLASLKKPRRLKNLQIFINLALMGLRGILFAIGILLMAAIASLMLISSAMLTEITGNRVSASPAFIQAPTPESFSFIYSETEQMMLDMGLVDIARQFPDILVQLVYSGDDNVMKRVVYSDMKRAFLYPVIARKLEQASSYLREEDSTMRLVVLDAARPQSIQYQIWDWALANNLQKYWAAPTMGSLHNFGCAVDVTLKAGDTLIDMGTDFDHMGPESATNKHWRLVKDGILTQQQVDNRNLLKSVMRKAGFRAIQREWWHFNGVSNNYAREHFDIIP